MDNDLTLDRLGEMHVLLTSLLDEKDREIAALRSAPNPSRDPNRRAYWVVDDFEEALADYCGAPHAVTVSSCTAALFLSLTLDRVKGNVHPFTEIQLPHRTYIGVVRSVRHAGFGVYWNYAPWEGRYWLSPSRAVIFKVLRPYKVQH